MARINPTDRGVYESLYGVDASLQKQIFAHQPEPAAALEAASQAVLFGGPLPDRLVELVRLRIAFHNQCRSCMAVRYERGVEAGVDEELVCSLERPQEAEGLSASEKAALHYADLFATNHLALDDGEHEALREHFEEAAIVQLGMVCAICVGIGRMSATWDMVDELPDRFRSPQGTITPWGEGETLRK